MKSSIYLLRHQSYRRCLHLCLHRQTLLFQNANFTTHVLCSSNKLNHFVLPFISRVLSTSSTHVPGNVNPSSRPSTGMPQCYKNLYNSSHSTLLQSYIRIRNLSDLTARCYSVSAPKYDDANKDSLKSSKYLGDNTSIIDRYIYVKTLNSLYADVDQGIILDTAYGDSRPDSDFDPSVPVIMALHDTPGSHRDVVPLLSFFAKLGCRTICPTFPGHGDTRGIMRNFDDIFSQATTERVVFVRDFLDDIDIKRVDVVIGTGASCYTAMGLCTQQTEVFKSMALISPWSLKQPRFNINNKMLKSIHELWELAYLRPVARLLLPAFNVGNAPTTEEKISSCYLVQNMDFGEAEGFALTASLKDVPRLVAYGGKDDLISEELYADLLYKLGIDSKDILSGQQGVPPKDIGNTPRALRFPDAGYNLITTHRSVLCANILRLLQHFHPSIKI